MYCYKNYDNVLGIYFEKTPNKNWPNSSLFKFSFSSGLTLQRGQTEISLTPVLSVTNGKCENSHVLGKRKHELKKNEHFVKTLRALQKFVPAHSSKDQILRTFQKFGDH